MVTAKAPGQAILPKWRGKQARSLVLDELKQHGTACSVRILSADTNLQETFLGSLQKMFKRVALTLPVTAPHFETNHHLKTKDMQCLKKLGIRSFVISVNLYLAEEDFCCPQVLFYGKRITIIICNTCYIYNYLS